MELTEILGQRVLRKCTCIERQEGRSGRCSLQETERSHVSYVKSNHRQAVKGESL